MNPKPLASLNHFTVPVMRAICALLLACTVPAAGGFACAAVERRDSHNSCVRAFPETRRGPQAEAQVLEQSLVQHTAPCHGPFARPKVHHSAELSQWTSPNHGRCARRCRSSNAVVRLTRAVQVSRPMRPLLLITVLLGAACKPHHPGTAPPVRVVRDSARLRSRATPRWRTARLGWS